MAENGKFIITPVTTGALETTGKMLLKAFAFDTIRKNFFYIKKDSELAEAELRALNEGNTKKYLSAFGLPVFDSVTIKGGNYLNDDDETVFYGQVELAIGLITIEKPKIIIETTVAGRKKGTVKEFIGYGDMQISIRGLFASRGQNVYPEDEMRDLLAILDVPDSVEVAGNVFQRFGIQNILIKDCSFNQDDGNRNVQYFTIKAVSDFPTELKTIK